MPEIVEFAGIGEGVGDGLEGTDHLFQRGALASSSKKRVFCSCPEARMMKRDSVRISCVRFSCSHRLIRVSVSAVL